jgi:hypothetical protein
MPKPGVVRITVYVPGDLLRKAMKITRLGITSTIRIALEALVKQDAQSRQLQAQCARSSERHRET